MGRDLSHARGDDFVRAPVGRWATAGSTVVWCLSPSLSGACAWGRPSAADCRAALALFDILGDARLAPRFDCVLDGHGLDGLDEDALRVLAEWTRARQKELARRVRLQVGIPPAGAAAAIPWATLGGAQTTRVEQEPRAAYALVPEGAPLADQLAAIVAGLRGVAPAVRALRELLRVRDGDITVEAAARALGTATRSLQRTLRENGTTFRGEQTAARFAIASELLLTTKHKVAEIAARVGLSESGLEALVRARSGMTPAELRRAGSSKPEA